MDSMNDQDLLLLGKKVHNLFSDYRSDTAVYGVGWEDGKVEGLSNHACHMALMKQVRYSGGYSQVSLRKGRGPLVISNQVQCDYNDEGKILDKKELKKYYSFLFNESVFSECYVTKDPDKCIKDGIVVRTNLPANLVVAACIATRQAWEYKEIGLSVNRLIKFGVEPRKAHIAAHSIKVEENGSYKNSYRGSHIAVYSEYMGRNAVRNFLSGTLCTKIEMNLLTYREARDYRNMPQMWGPAEDKHFDVCQMDTLPQSTSDPFGFIKHVGEMRKQMDVVEAVEQAFERILK